MKEPKITYGIEIHQQLNTAKLHCKCNSDICSEYLHEIKRKLFVRVGETGKEDIAAKFEELKRQTFIYEIDPKFCCLVEMDEEPPKPINEEALLLAIKIAELFEAELVDRAYVMRKIIIDGSNVSGFQRTTLIAYDGHLIVDGYDVKIPTICLEEDSARIIERLPGQSRFRLDRLGIPLVEISTEPISESISIARKIMEEIGLSLRLLGGVRRGIGTIRQDVNVSIEGGSRVELKGIPTLNIAEKAIKYEAKRQENLLELKKILIDKGITEEDFKEVKPKDLTEIFSNTSSNLIKKLISSENRVYGIKAPGFKDLFYFDILPGKHFGKELAEIVKAMSGLKGILHSDEILKYGVSEEEFNNIKKELECESQDGFILVITDSITATVILELLKSRLQHCVIGVPKEVRKVLEDGTSVFLRPLPGAERMYPETDIPSIDLQELKKKIEIEIEPIWIKREKYKKLGLSDDEINILIRGNLWKIFEEFSKEFNPRVVSRVLCYEINKVKEILNKELTKEQIRELILLFEKYELPVKFLKEVIKIWKDSSESLIEIIEKEKVDRTTLEKEISELIKNKTEKEILKEILIKFNFKVNIKEVNEIIKKYSSGVYE